MISSYKLNQIFKIAMDENKTFAAKGKKCWFLLTFYWKSHCLFVFTCFVYY